MERSAFPGMKDIPGWGTIHGTKIQRMFEFKDFSEAMIFVNKVSGLAEAADHHPEILINYKKVTLTLWTHSAGGLTEKDYELAKKIDAIS